MPDKDTFEEDEKTIGPILDAIIDALEGKDEAGKDEDEDES